MSKKYPRLLLKIKLLFILITLSAFANAQTPDTILPKKVVAERSLRLLTGFSFGKKTFADIGISKNSNAVVGPHPFFSAYFISCEIKPGDNFILGPKVGAWIAGGVGGVAMGVNTIYYTDFEKGSLAFRPEIGFGFGNFKLVYGYNAILTKRKLDGINSHVGSVVYCFRLKKLKDKIR